MCRSFFLKKSEDKRSGDTYNNLISPNMQLSSVEITSWRDIPEWIATAVIDFLRKFCTWSFINAMSGVITIHVPSINKAGT